MSVETEERLEPRNYNAAMKFMVSSGQVSTSAIQRQFDLGYNAAAELIERFEANAIISKPNEAGRRRILIHLPDVEFCQRKEVPSDDPLEREAEEAMEAAMGKAETPGKGHNSGDTGTGAAVADGDYLNQTAKQKLRLTIQRIEALEADRKEVGEQIKEVKAEAKALGYDVRAINDVIKIRKQDRQERQEREAILETYLDALGEL